MKRLNTPSYGAAVPDLDSSIDLADLIVVGSVRSVEYLAGQDGALPTSRATVTIEETLKGTVPEAGLVITQLGGPVTSDGDGGGALAQLETDELLLLGDTALLMLKKNQFNPDEINALLGSGIIFIRGDVITPEASNVFGDDLRNKTVAELLILVRSKL